MQVKPRTMAQPSMAELEAAAYKALRLPSEEHGAEHGLAHFLGTVTIERNDAALDAVLELWTRRVREAVHVARALAPPDWNQNPSAFTLTPEDARCNFLRFEEYLDQVRSLGRAHPTPPAPSPYRPYDTNVRGRFAASFKPRRHTPDRRGYHRYLDDHAPEKITRFVKKRLPVCLPEENRRLNSYVFASPGSGKSELLKLLVHAEVRRKRPSAAVVVLDVAGDLANELRFREFAEDDSRLVFIDPVLDLRHTPCLNPLEVRGSFVDIEEERHAKDRQADQVFIALDQALRDAPEGGSLTPQMIAVVKPAIRALLDIPCATFEHLERLMLGDPGLEARCCRSTGDRAATFFRQSFGHKTYETSRGGIASRLQATFLAEDKFKDLTCGATTIPLERLIEERRIIVFNLSKDNVTRSVALAFGRFILAMINAIGYRRARVDKAERTVTHVIIDEFQNFITGSVFEAIEELRKHNIRQTLAQPTLFAGMSTDQRRAFQTGVQGAYFFGKCGSRSTAEYVASLAGGIDPDGLVELSEDKERTGEFFVHTQGRPTFLLQTDDRLVDVRHTLNQAEWEPLKRRQLERYYRPKEAWPATGEPEVARPEPPPQVKPEAVPQARPAASRTVAPEPPRKPREPTERAREAGQPSAAAAAPRPQPAPEVAIKRPPRRRPGPL